MRAIAIDADEHRRWGLWSMRCISAAAKCSPVGLVGEVSVGHSRGRARDEYDATRSGPAAPERPCQLYPSHYDHGPERAVAHLPATAP